MRRLVPTFPGSIGVLGVLGVLGAGPASAQERRLGAVDFPNSGAAEAQADFLEGVLLLHSFEYGDAAEAFRRARATDPGFALAYWGEAMTYNHPVWQEQDREAARAVLDAFEGPAPTEREALYLASLDVLYAPAGTKAERDRRYMEAMRRLHERFPEDLEARAFYALSLLGLTAERDFANYMRAAAVAGPVLDANPEHPGAAHYVIHAFDDPVHAPLGLPAARAYGAIAPDAGHAQHMTSHIFLAMGMWDDVIRANINAQTVVDRARARRDPEALPNRCGHYAYWLHYGYLMKEQWDDARALMDGCRANLTDPDRDDRSYYAWMRGRHVLDSGDPAAAGRWGPDPAAGGGPALLHAFVDGYAALERGDPEVTRSALRTLEAAGQGDPRTGIMALELRALLARHDGDRDAAVALLREAAATEESLPFEFGPPASVKPPHELLGEVLLAAGRLDEAVEAFRGALAITPLRTPSLRGLAAAARGAGMVELAAEMEGRLAEITGADAPSFGGP